MNNMDNEVTVNYTDRETLVFQNGLPTRVSVDRVAHIFRTIFDAGEILGKELTSTIGKRSTASSSTYMSSITYVIYIRDGIKYVVCEDTPVRNKILYSLIAI
jgi:hypothetical protein